MNQQITVRNSRTGETRQIAPPTLNALERWWDDAISPCQGPCECDVEPDGVCPQGWHARAELLWELP